MMRENAVPGGCALCVLGDDREPSRGAKVQGRRNAAPQRHRHENEDES